MGGKVDWLNANEFARQSFRFNLKNELERKVYENKFSIFERNFYLRWDINPRTSRGEGQMDRP